MAINRWDPYREVFTLESRFKPLFRGFDQGAALTAGFTPAVDIFEDAEKVVLKLEVPGIEEKDLDVRVEKNTLTVKGQRNFEKEEKEENFHRIERRYGSFFRSFTVPTTVNPEGVKASYDAGVLRIELEKRAEAKPKQIKVQVGSGSRSVESKPAA